MKQTFFVGVRTDEEPLYDSVASDDDYATAEQLAIMVCNFHVCNNFYKSL